MATHLSLPLRHRRWRLRDIVSAASSAALAVLGAFLLYKFYLWAVVDAVWEAGSAAQCAQRGSGACWAVIRERGRLLMFGLLPHSEEWRASLGSAIILLAVVLSCVRPFQRATVLVPLWGAVIALFSVLLSGAGFDNTPVERTSWGGLSLTFYIFAAHAFPPRQGRWRLRDIASAASSAALAVLGAFLLYEFYHWAIVDAVWEAGSAAECAQKGSGACWAVIRERGRLVLFGLFPQSEEWRASLGSAIILVAVVLSCLRRFQRATVLVPLWGAAMAVFSVLLSGGWFGLAPVERTSWGGLSLTFYIFAAMLILGMPLSILFALGRTSGPQWVSIPLGMFVDTIRSIPLTAILFFMALVLPTLFATQLLGDKLMRVIFGFSIFFACYQSEVIRGGLQALDRGQVEAGRSLGLSRFDILARIVLPQVFRTVLPQTVNQIVTAFKDTSYVAIIGFFDMTSSASAALGSGQWAAAFVEVYLMVAFLYLVFGYSLSRYGAYLERKSDVAYQR